MTTVLIRVPTGELSEKMAGFVSGSMSIDPSLQSSPATDTGVFLQSALISATMEKLKRSKSASAHKK